ncbi:MAG TPA: hypothetical protein VMV14_00005, partial [Acidimicrobiales bacterium]|nr:hypothetical protein [Acidimicrobiales bacterium]
MTLATSGPPRIPLESVPARGPGSVRRTMHVDVGPRTDWGVALPIVAGARDLRSSGEGDLPQVLGEARLEAGFDTERRLVSLEARPPAPWTSHLLGTRAGGGFRRRLDELVPPEDRQSL